MNSDDNDETVAIEFCAEEGLRLLHAFVSPESTSIMAQHTTPTLSEDTVSKVSSWIGSLTDHASSIMWLSGLPGTSSVSEVIELCDEAVLFAASFRFSSRKGSEQTQKVFPSLASQLAVTIPILRLLIGLAVYADPKILSKRADIQFDSFFLAPFNKFNFSGHSSPFPVIVIDSIELHPNPKEQHFIIWLIELAVTSKRLPLRFIFTTHSDDYLPPFHEATHIHVAASTPTTRHPDSSPSKIRPSPLSPSFPYRGFPKLVQTQYSAGRSGAADSYTRSLMMLGHGFPVFLPQGTSRRPQTHLLVGVGIGDVLGMDSDGEYIFLFNIFRDHQDGQARATPSHFQPIRPLLDPSEVTRTESYFKRGAVLSSPGLSSKIESTSPLHVSFESKQQEGAALVLPDGGSREDLASTHRFLEYVKRWAPYWYNVLPAPIINGSLFLVTGCDKVSNYATMWFPYQYPSRQQASPPISMSYHETDGHKTNPWATRSGDGGGTWHNPARFAPVRKGGRLPAGARPLCVFVRGLRIGLCESTWSGAIGGNAGYEKFFYTTVLHKTPTMRSVGATILAAFHRRISEKTALYELSSQWKQLVHPFYLLGPLLLAKHPSARVAVVDDAIWCSFVDKRETGTLNALNALIDRALDHCVVTDQDGIVFLAKKQMFANDKSNTCDSSARTQTDRYDRHGKIEPISQYATDILSLPPRELALM